MFLVVEQVDSNIRFRQWKHGEKNDVVQPHTTKIDLTYNEQMLNVLLIGKIPTDGCNIHRRSGLPRFEEDCRSTLRIDASQVFDHSYV